MRNRFISFVSAMVCMAAVAQAQVSPCSTDEHYQKLLQKYPQLAEYEKQLEAQAKLAYKTTTGPDTATYDIPMVVHVVHDYGIENLNDTIIYNAAAYWSKVYNKQNYADTAGIIAPFKKYAGNAKMRLHLATKDPNGNPTKGIVRHFSYLTANGSDQAKYGAWPNNKYVNVWLINAFGAGAAGAAAYAYYPSTGAGMPLYDGIICLSSYVDSTDGSRQKTIPHELGHVLNLQHVWGSTNSPGVACGDDGVWDTPPTMGHNPVGCTLGALYDVTCAGAYTHTFISSSGLSDSVVNYPDTVNAQNIMDYTYCSRMFTEGQCARMRAALTGATAGRNNLITASNLAATGALDPMPDLPPVADFTENKAVVAGGVVTELRTQFLTFNNAGSFVFRNASWNDTISSVQWQFSNGATTPASTSMTTVNNQFSQPGWVTVKLTANSNAGTDSIVNTQAVYAADTTSVGGLGYVQNFSSASAISNWPMFNYYNNQFKWEVYSGAGYDDSSCIRFHSWDGSARNTGEATGDIDDIYTPAFNLDGLTGNLYINFRVNGANTTSGLGWWIDAVNDSLEIDASNSGGLRWQKIGGLTGNQMATAGTKVAEYSMPDPAKWVQKGVSIPSSYRTNNTFFRIRYRPGTTGNNVYLDNFAISATSAGVAEVIKSTNSFTIYPNPSAAGCTVAFKSGSSGIVNYSITDLAGRVVYTAEKTYVPDSINEENISRSVTPAAGMYFVTLTIDGVNTTQKLVVY